MTAPQTRVDLQRRRLLAAGSLTVAFPLLARAAGPAQSTTEAGSFAAVAPNLPGSLKTTPMLDAWIKIDEHGQITAFTGKAELGTGIATAFVQIAAEQLAVPPGFINLITADTALTPNEGYTAGSHSIADSGTAILNAAAQVRALLIGSAAQRLNVDPASLRLNAGTLLAPDGRTLSYGEAVSGAQIHRQADPHFVMADASSYQVIGSSYARVDIPAKVGGGPSYVQDLRLPGMVHGRVVRPPAYGATLAALDSSAIEAMPGVLKVVRDGSYLAVIARDEWQAIQAMRALALAARWHSGPPLPAPQTILDTLMTLPAQHMPVANRTAPAAAAVQTLHARYRKPYLSHGSIGPSCAVARYDAGGLTVWSHTQGVFPLRKGLAELLALPLEQVRCIHTPGAGCYGHNGADDVAADAALLARLVPGQPVRVQWMREQEQLWEPFGPAMTTDVSASLDANGMIVDWRFDVWSNPHNNRIENAGRLMPSWLLAQPFSPAPPKEIPMPEGGGDRNSIPLYRIPTLSVQNHFIAAMPIRTSALRSLGAYHNVFSIESFIDELADAAQADPVQFRLRHLNDPRARDVITLAAAKFGWPAGAAGLAASKGRGRGFAFAQYKNLMAYCALAVEISIDGNTGDVCIERAVAAIDCGQIVNPDGVRNQVEGGVIQSASWTLFERVSFDQDSITSFDWSAYPILRFAAMPRSLEVHLIDRPGQPFLGVGEAAQGPTAAALANAVAHATGIRVRELPLADAARAMALRA
jgi:nicotinate dehydrogenase subunit B